MELNTDWNEFLQLLESFDVKYLLVGAIARSLIGEPRTTGDIDFWVSNDRENAEKMVAVADRFGFGSLGLTLDDFLADDIVVQLGYPPRRIDIMTAISGIKFDEAWENRTICSINGIKVNVISKGDFIKNKLATGRAKDLADVEELG